MDVSELTSRIDHTNLRPNATEADIVRLCDEARKYRFRAVCVQPKWLDLVREELEDEGILIATVIDFPHGQGGYLTKQSQAAIAREKGAGELDVVWDVGAFLSRDYDRVISELSPLARTLPTKVIVELGYLLVGSDDERRKRLPEAVQLVEESGAFCIKTETGFGPSVAFQKKIEAIQIFKETVPELFVKASAGIRTLGEVQQLLDAGADIIGTSSGVAIVEEFEKQR